MPVSRRWLLTAAWSMALGVFVIGLALPTLRVEAADPPPAASGVTVYDPSPAHLWNRLHATFAVRLSGERSSDPGDLDPFLWRRGPDEATGERYQRAVAVLDQLIAAPGDQLLTDPRKRALLQRDLWVLFDTVAPSRFLLPPGKTDGELELAQRLARLLPRLALTADQIKALPDTYAEAVAAKQLPSWLDAGRLWEADGSWVLLGSAERVPVARSHVEFFGGRSAFFVFLRLPGGREATRKYVAELRPDGNAPELPRGSQTALVRQMQLIDDRGRLTLTPVVETVQIRGGGVFKLQLDRQAFLAGKPSLKAQGAEDRERSYLSFLGRNTGNGRGKVLDSCFHCHQPAFPVNSYGRPFPPAQSIRPRLLASGRDEEALRARLWKKERYEWGLLQGLIRSPKAD